MEYTAFKSLTHNLQSAPEKRFKTTNKPTAIVSFFSRRGAEKDAKFKVKEVFHHNSLLLLSWRTWRPSPVGDAARTRFVCIQTSKASIPEKTTLNLQPIQQHVSVSFDYKVYFTNEVFKLKNHILAQLIADDGEQKPKKIVIVVDAGLLEFRRSLLRQIGLYTKYHADILTLAGDPIKDLPLQLLTEELGLSVFLPQCWEKMILVSG